MLTRHELGQDLYFYKNLPIRWARLVGIVVAIDDFTGRRIYTVDDSSGRCIECTLSSTRAIPKADIAAAEKKEDGLTTTQPAKPDSKPADYAEIDVGAVVDVKGSVTTFREEKQLKIVKIKILKSTEQELALWERRTRFQQDVLQKPWTLSKKQLRKCRKEAEGSPDDPAAKMREHDDDSRSHKRKKETKRPAAHREGRGRDTDSGNGAGARLVARRLLPGEKGRYDALGL